MRSFYELNWLLYKRVCLELGGRGPRGRMAVVFHFCHQHGDGTEAYPLSRK